MILFCIESASSFGLFFCALEDSKRRFIAARKRKTEIRCFVAPLIHSHLLCWVSLIVWVEIIMLRDFFWRHVCFTCNCLGSFRLKWLPWAFLSNLLSEKVKWHQNFLCGGLYVWVHFPLKAVHFLTHLLTSSFCPQEFKTDTEVPERMGAGAAGEAVQELLKQATGGQQRAEHGVHVQAELLQDGLRLQVRGLHVQTHRTHQSSPGEFRGQQNTWKDKIGFKWVHS